jgi:hypothetical protein
LPFPNADPVRQLNLIVELLERSSLPLVGTFLLYLGFCGDALPAIWECRTLLLIRRLLWLLVLLYILLAITFLSVSPRVEADRIADIELTLQQQQQGLAQLRENIDAANPDQLRAFLQRQPQLREALDQLPDATAAEPAANQRERTRQLVERLDANLRRQAQASRAQLSFAGSRSSARTVLTAFAYAIYYLLAAQIWPRSLASTFERVLAAAGPTPDDLSNGDPPQAEPPRR